MHSVDIVYFHAMVKELREDHMVHDIQKCQKMPVTSTVPRAQAGVCPGHSVFFQFFSVNNDNYFMSFCVCNIPLACSLGTSQHELASFICDYFQRRYHCIITSPFERSFFLCFSYSKWTKPPPRWLGTRTTQYTLMIQTCKSSLFL